MKLIIKINYIQILDNVDLQRASEISKGKKRRLCESILKGRYVETRYTKGKERDHRFDTCLTYGRIFRIFNPEIFEEVIAPEIYDDIVKEMVRFATTCKNIIDFRVSVAELKSFIGILLF